MSLLAAGLSAATNSTPLSISPLMTWTFRASRSSLAMTSVAFRFLHSQRRCELGSLDAPAGLDLSELVEERPGAAVQELADARSLSLEPARALRARFRSARSGRSP